jgi:hypothetical protein
MMYDLIGHVYHYITHIFTSSPRYILLGSVPLEEGSFTVRSFVWEHVLYTCMHIFVVRASDAVLFLVGKTGFSLLSAVFDGARLLQLPSLEAHSRMCKS